MNNKRTLSGSLALTKLQHAVIKVKGKNGMVPGIFIPIENNHLVPGKNGAYYMPIRVLLHDQPDDYGQDGFISQSVDTKKYLNATDAEKQSFRDLPILGNVKDFSQSADASGRIDDIEPEVNSNDDLPF